MITVQKDPTTLRSVDFVEKNKLSEEQCYRNNYDHFSYDNNRVSEITSDINRIDFKDFKTHREEISDHVSVSLDLNFGRN